MIGTGEDALFTPEDMQAIRDRMQEIQRRIRDRAGEIESLAAEREPHAAEDVQPQPAAEDASADRVEEIRQSVTDERIRERVERISADPNGATDGGQDGPPADPDNGGEEAR